MNLKLASIALLPLLVLQGQRVKRNTLRLAEPEGARQGCIGQGRPLSILIVGDSAVAGVGVEQQDQALLGQLLACLQDHYQVTYQLHAKTGRTTAQLIRAVQALSIQKVDVVITSVGVNDVTRLMPVSLWMQQQKRLYAVIQNKFNPQLILAASVPPMHLFPALPQPMAWLLGEYAKQMNQQLQAYVHSQSQMLYLDDDLEQYQAMNLTMAKDGFHPSQEIYAFWARAMAEKIQTQF
ncbi:SGNH/GDSL hydrolase family protein [Acinetobacter sp. B51(2017)]|uniref:SGNH/GDSL hydrolase family protein n=1 Tax=Acinetobacter sp. B51(2017) TaxID=2060938 RepID=UPI000F086B62|nr:SGNH/GDSL hydrolase family protein [Acinetobacter sp. B51(2017)]